PELLGDLRERLEECLVGEGRLGTEESVPHGGRVLGAPSAPRLVSAPHGPFTVADPVAALPVADVLEGAASALDGAARGGVVGVAGDQHGVDAERGRDLQTLREGGGGDAPAASTGADGVADVSSHLEEEGRELVADGEEAEHLPGSGLSDPAARAVDPAVGELCGGVLLRQAPGDELAELVVGPRRAGGVGDTGAVHGSPGEGGEAVRDLGAQGEGRWHELDVHGHRMIVRGQNGGPCSQYARLSSSGSGGGSCRGSAGPHSCRIRSISPIACIWSRSRCQQNSSHDSMSAFAWWGAARSPRGATRVVIRAGEPTVQVVAPSGSRTGSMRPAVFRSWCLQSRRWRLWRLVGPPRAGSAWSNSSMWSLDRKRTR